MPAPDHTARTLGGRHRSVRPRWGSTVVVASAFLVAGGASATAAMAAASPSAGTSVTSVAAVASPLVTPGPVSPPAVTPAEPAGLPAGIEDPSPYLKQVSCDPTSTPGAVALGNLLRATYPGTSYGVGRECGADGIASEHYEGRAVDWMTSVRDPAGAARAEAFLGWLLAPDAQGHAFANARRLGVMYVIWDNRIWGSYAPASGWRPYSSCANHPESGWDTSCHRNHVHLSLSWAGAQARTSYWTGHVAPVDYGPCRPADLNWAPAYSGANPSPCPSFGTVTARAGSSPVVAAVARYSGATVGLGSTGPVVSALQGALGAPVDGDFGQVTGAAVSSFRAAHGLPAGSRVDAATWRALLAALSSGATSPSGSSAGAPGSGGATSAAGPTGNPVASGAAPTGSSASGAPAAGSAAPGSAGSPSASAAPVLSYGASGTAVAALQRALHVTPVSGWYGPVTRAAVVAFQAAHGLPRTGAVDAATGQALAR